MQNIQEEMEYITKIAPMILDKFDNRPNNEKDKIDFESNAEKYELIVQIARTHYYLQKNYPEKLDISNVEGMDRIEKQLQKSKPTTLADLYLDRLLLNFKKLEWTNGNSPKGEVQPQYAKVLFNLDSIDRQVEYWFNGNVLHQKYYRNDLINNKEQIARSLRYKVFAHELAHASAIANFNDGSGFYEGGKTTYCSRLEEIMAEKIALDVTGQKIPARQEIKLQDGTQYRIAGYNPESSNFYNSAFIELVPFAFGEKDIMVGRMSNPKAYMEKLNNKYQMLGDENKTFAQTLNDDLRDITDKNDIEKLIKWQTNFLEMGRRRLNSSQYLTNCSEQEFIKDTQILLRIGPMLCVKGQNNEVVETRNRKKYDLSLRDMENNFNALKERRKMFTDYKDFDELKQEISEQIVESNLQSLGVQSQSLTQ